MIDTKKKLNAYNLRDAEMNNFKGGLAGLLGNDIKSFLRALRYYEYVLNTKHNVLFLPLKLLSLYRFKKLSKKLGFSIPPNVCGPGLMLPHYGNIVINRKSQIGRDCKIHVGVNIGAGHGVDNGSPVIGDNCYLAPGAKLFGGIRIGQNSKIGANAVVNKSFPESGHVIVGVPARSIRRDLDKD